MLKTWLATALLVTVGVSATAFGAPPPKIKGASHTSASKQTGAWAKKETAHIKDPKAQGHAANKKYETHMWKNGYHP